MSVAELVGLSVGGFVVFFGFLFRMSRTWLNIDYRDPETARSALIGWLVLTGVPVLIGTLNFFDGSRRPDAGALARLSALALGSTVGFVVFRILHNRPHRPHVRWDVPPVVIGALAIGIPCTLVGVVLAPLFPPRGDFMSGVVWALIPAGWLAGVLLDLGLPAGWSFLVVWLPGQFIYYLAIWYLIRKWWRRGRAPTAPAKEEAERMS